MTSKLKQLREKIIEANPNIACRNISVSIPKPFGGIINYRDDTIRWEDIFIAFYKNDKDLGDYILEEKNITFIYDENIEWTWQLGIDLDHQKPEVWDMLLKLLV